MNTTVSMPSSRIAPTAHFPLLQPTFMAPLRRIPLPLTISPREEQLAFGIAPQIYD